MSRIFAYCRISTLDQTTENQRREIESAGFKIKPQQIIEEHISGSAATSERPGFNRLLARLKCGDQLIVTKLDRLGCNAMDIRKTVEQLTETGIRVHCLALGGIDLTSPTGKMMMPDTTLSRPEVVSGHTDVIYSTSVCHILAVRKSTLLPIDTIIRHQVSDIS